MAKKDITGSTTTLRHGASHLPAVVVDTYNAELRDAEGFVGDRASRRAFASLLEDWRERLRAIGQDDPFGELSVSELRNGKLDRVLQQGDAKAAALLHSAIEEFAQELSAVIRRFLRLKEWRDTKAIVIGGGFRASRIGEIAIARAALLLKADGQTLEFVPISHHPDEAGLIGCVQLAPSWIFSGYDAVLAVDIGGTNFRVGLLELNIKKKRNLSAARVVCSELWRHADEKPDPDTAVARLAKMLGSLLGHAEEEKLALAPFIGIGCPGLIREDGSIERGGQNLPGNWETKGFNLPHRLLELIPAIGGHDVSIIMHNDAVVQGLSEVPAMRKVAHWGVLTIGTGLGNAHFSAARSSRKGK